MLTEKIEIEIPVGMRPYIVGKDKKYNLRRNAMLLYPLVLDKTISHGKAAEILGMRKSDLICLYEQMGFPYLDHTMDELNDDLAAMESLGFVRKPV